MSRYARITATITRIITGVFLTTAFVLGVGPVAALFRLTGRRLLKNHTELSTWNNPSGSKLPGRMY